MLKQRLFFYHPVSTVTTTLYSWGNSTSYATGQNTTTTITTPTAISASTWKKVVSFGGNTVGYGGFAIKSDGTLWSWGDSSNYGTGQNITTNIHVPTKVGTDSDWVDVAGFGGGGFALKSNGKLYSWGESGLYQTGQNTTTNVQVPTQVGTDADWASVAAASNSGFAIKTNGKLYAWGSGISYCTGLNTTADTHVPTQVGTDTDWLKVVGGGFNAFAIKTNRKLYSWGSSSNYATGQNTTTNIQIPTQVGSTANWIDIAAVAYSGFGLQADGSLWSWGQSSSYQTGQGSTTAVQVPTRIGTDSDWEAVFGGFTGATGFARKSSKDNYSWGYSADYEGGNGGTANITAPTLITGANGWSSFSCSTSAFAIKGLTLPSLGSIFAWGSNNSGKTGLGTTSGTATVPSAISGTSGTWTKISACVLPANGFGADAGGQTTALKSDGTLWSWGANAGSGCIGQGSAGNVLFPTKIGTDTDWADVAQGGIGGLAVKTNGTLWAWGYDLFGALGLGGSGASSLTPVQISMATTWSKVFISNYNSFIIDTSGQLWTMGTPLSVENGLNSAGTARLTPTQVGSATNWKSIVTCGDQGNTGPLPFTIGLHTDGTIWSVGYNVNGQTAQGTTSSTTNTFTKIGTDTDWASIGAFSNYAASSGTNYYGCGFAIKTNGKLYSWGSSIAHGQGATGNLTVPTQIGTDTDWKMVTGGSTGGTASAGTTHGGYGLALKTTGKIYSWGDNTSSQAGQGTSSLTNVPTQIGTATNWTYIAAGGAQGASTGAFGFAIGT